MIAPAESASPYSGETREYFDSVAPFWHALYGRPDVYSLVHRERWLLALSLFDRAMIPEGSQILEIGCGAGFGSVEIAKRGYPVMAVDFARDMLQITRENAEKAGVSGSIRTGQCDTRYLPFADASFSAVMALGVLPWLPALAPPLAEMARVLKPGGHLIVTMDNRWRLNHYADPASWVRPAITKAAARLGLCKPQSIPRTICCSVSEFDGELRKAGFQKLWGGTLGFGPFWLINKLLPHFVGAGIHRGLQTLADRRVPVLRSTGMQYVVLSRKEASGNG